MSNDLLCPSCFHPLGQHSYYYGTCEAPIGGTFNHDKCGCILTLHDLIKNLQTQDLSKKVEALQARLDTCVNEMVNALSVMKPAQERLVLLSTTMKSIEEILHEAKIIEETRPFYGWFTIDYRNEMHLLIDKALLEVEKTHE